MTLTWYLQHNHPSLPPRYMFKKPQVLLVPGRVQRRLERNARKDYYRSRRTYTRSTAMVVRLVWFHFRGNLSVLSSRTLTADEFASSPNSNMQYIHRRQREKTQVLTFLPARPPNTLRLRRRPPLRLPRRRQTLHRPNVSLPGPRRPLSFVLPGPFPQGISPST